VFKIWSTKNGDIFSGSVFVLSDFYLRGNHPQPLFEKRGEQHHFMAGFNFGFKPLLARVDWNQKQTS